MTQEEGRSVYKRGGSCTPENALIPTEQHRHVPPLSEIMFHSLHSPKARQKNNSDIKEISSSNLRCFLVVTFLKN